MMRRGVSLLELIFVLVIVSMLAVATFKGISAILVRSYKAKVMTELSLQSQIVVDQIAQYLHDRVPATVIGYGPDANFEYIGDLTQQRPILEWIARAVESYNNRDFSGFVDLARSDRDAKTIFSPDTNGSKIAETTKAKFGIDGDLYADKILNLIFAGAYDRGSIEGEYEDAFGWHGGESQSSFDIDIDDNGTITITDSVQPYFIYEKYYLVDSAYAIARGADIDQGASCLDGLGVDGDTLLLFYDYRPWKGETFCADPNGGERAGKAAILMRNVIGFAFWEEGRTIRIELNVAKTIKDQSRVRINKQKVVF